MNDDYKELSVAAAKKAMELISKRLQIEETVQNKISEWLASGAEGEEIKKLLEVQKLLISSKELITVFCNLRGETDEEAAKPIEVFFGEFESYAK